MAVTNLGHIGLHPYSWSSGFVQYTPTLEFKRGD